MFATIVYASLALGGIGVAQGKGPIVDLGHSLHRGRLNESGGFYAFNNIRFAEPVKRFRLPNALKTLNRTVLNDGSFGNICPQAYPLWLLKKTGLSRQSLDKLIEGGSRQDEDCLFLDVVVSKKAWENRPVDRSRVKTNATAPVLVWIHGGGFVFGQKRQSEYDPAGLMKRAQEDGGQGIVYVAINYRLGLYGWLNAGPHESVVPNLGLADQRIALTWIERNIHTFGGDKRKVTLMGQSAGGGSIMSHITALGGSEAPFARAIIQSPYLAPIIDSAANWASVLATASEVTGRGIRNSGELGRLDAEMLKTINSEVVAKSPTEGFTFGPSVDGGVYLPAPPDVLLRQRRFNPEPALLIGHTSHEWLALSLPEGNSTAAMETKLKGLLPGLGARTRNLIFDELYPPPGPKTLYEYRNQEERSLLLRSELFINCNTRQLSTAFVNKTFNYRFQVPPGSHGKDVAYTFFNGEAKGIIGSLALDMQRYFLNFAEFGNPNGRGSVPKWPVYGEDATLATFGTEGVGFDMDETRNRRCEYWQTGKFRADKMAAFFKAANAKIRSHPLLSYVCSTHFWGPVSNFGIPVAAVLDTQKSPELISGSMTGALCIYSLTFMRYSLAVTPRNYLLFLCHFVNEGAQLTQGYRYLSYHNWGGKEKLELERGMDAAKEKAERVSDTVKSAVGK
ncbi:hypothetical protein CDD80_4506 [Ophiocordyceps camponoti-rufipedis]|uniref:Carboxylic ester hydrolase n=1 Tax=Ophiocordyceps camponoti-rufipedis TaxID=2004952 RepID=A0A2C5YYN8_9HYPO|nr:hypothetical protein CDD80_4506 [Ophiocordyceps camponoti-rufipedis]